MTLAVKQSVPVHFSDIQSRAGPPASVLMQNPEPSYKLVRHCYFYLSLLYWLLKRHTHTHTHTLNSTIFVLIGHNNSWNYTGSIVVRMNRFPLNLKHPLLIVARRL